MRLQARIFPLLIVCLWLATALAAWQLNRDALWYDEILSYYYVGAAQFGPLLPPMDFLERLVTKDRWPPLYYLSLTAWSQLAGWSVFSGRVLALYYGVLTIAVTYRLAVDTLKSRTAALISMVMLSSSAFFLYFMHEIRGYTLYPLALMLSLLFYWRVLSCVTRWRAFGFVGFTLAALYSHIATYPIIAAVGLYHLLFARHRATWARVLFLFAVVGFLTLPWLFVLYFKLQQGQTIGQITPWLPLVWFLPAFGNRVWWLLAAALVYALWAVRGRGAGYVAFVLVVSFALTLLINVLSPFLFHMRHVVGLVPLLLILCGAAAAHAARRVPRVVAALIIVWMAAGIWNTFDFRYMLATPGHEPTIPAPAMNTLVDAAACIGPDDAVILHIGAPVLRGLPWEWINDVVMIYYWRDVPFRFAHISTLDPITNDDPMGEDPQVQVTEMSAYPPKAARFIDGAAQVWRFRLKDLPSIEQTALLEDVLQQQGYTDKTQVIDTANVAAWVYTQQGGPDAACP